MYYINPLAEGVSSIDIDKDGKRLFPHLNIGSENQSAFYEEEVDPKEELITIILKKGSLIADGKYRIYDACMYGSSNFANFLKDEYGLGGSYNGGIGWDSSAKGIHIKVSARENPDENFQTLLSWKEVAKRITELVNKGDYLTDKESEKLTEYYTKQQSKKEEALQSIAKDKIDLSQANPMAQEYFQLEQQYPGKIVLYRLGDFYEVFGENAVRSAEVLDLTLTGRDVGLAERLPMCGFPYHVADKYIAKLTTVSDVVLHEGKNEENRIFPKQNTENREKTQKGIFEQELYGIIYNYKGIKEENYIYTRTQLEKLVPSFVPDVDNYEGSFSANKSYYAFKLNGENEQETKNNVRQFLTGGNNLVSEEGFDWYWETLKTDLFTGYENETAINIIEQQLGLSESELTSNVEPELDDDYPIDLPNKHYVRRGSKSVEDSNGFLSEYTWWQSEITGHSVFYFDDTQDWETETEQEAQDWFDNYSTNWDDEEDMKEELIREDFPKDFESDFTEALIDASEEMHEQLVQRRRESELENVVSALRDEVQSEYNQFKANILQRTPEEIFDRHLEIYVKTEFNDTIQNHNFDEEYNKALYSERDKGILQQLYMDFINEEYSSVSNAEDTVSFIIDYCERYHSDIVNTQEENDDYQIPFIDDVEMEKLTIEQEADKWAENQENQEKLQKFITKAVSEIKWLNGKVANFTEDEIADIVNDIKVDFEGSEFDGSSEVEPFDSWYDWFIEETLIPELQSRVVNKEQTNADQKKKWLTVKVSHSAMIKEMPEHLFMRMPPNGKYGDYTYNVFKSKVKDSTQLVDMLSDSREMCFELLYAENETITLRNRKGEVSITAEEFKDIVHGTSDKDYPREIDDKNKKEKEMNNSLVMQGKLASKVEIKKAENGTVYARIPLEVQSEYNGNVTSSVYNITVFGQTAEELGELDAGAFITVKGRADVKKFDGKNVLSLIGTKVEKAEEGYKNTFALSGFVNNKQLELKETKHGTKYVSLALSVKNEYKNSNDYDTYFITAYGKSAERIVKDYQQRDLIDVSGAVQVDDGRISLIGTRSTLIRSATSSTQQPSTNKQNSNNKDENSDNGNF